MTNREGSLEAPERHALDWRSDDFYDLEAIHAEMDRVFDICHGCRRCFNLCASFPLMFDLIDDSTSGEADALSHKDHDKIAEACTLCDLCFMTKCPYVPPHEFNLDFPHLILRYRAAQTKSKGAPFTEQQLAQTERNGKLARPVAGMVNWATRNKPVRAMMEAVAGIDSQVELPRYHSKTFSASAGKQTTKTEQTNSKHKAVIYSSCLVDYNAPRIGMAAKSVLEANDVTTQIANPGCCAMPFLEHGDIAKVAKQAERISASLRPWIDDGYAVITPIASCGLMMKFEWPLILPENDDIAALADACRDICEYVVELATTDGLKLLPKSMPEQIGLHMACHSRAQNMGRKSAELLSLIPDAELNVVERCSGHGGTFGIMKKTSAMARQTAKPAIRALQKNNISRLCSDCPLGCKHLAQELAGQSSTRLRPEHPIEIFAAACGL